MNSCCSDWTPERGCAHWDPQPPRDTTHDSDPNYYPPMTADDIAEWNRLMPEDPRASWT